MPTIPERSLPGLPATYMPVALGFMNHLSFDAGAPVLDAFTHAGGTIFDTAWVYSGGYTEQLLGEWFASRGTRDSSIVIGKGAHTPRCVPEAIAAELTESLERMQTDQVDVYFMHRDNPTVPVGEFVDAMDAEVRAGRIRGAFGGSNWTMERFDEAIAYADSAGRQRPAVLSNNFSLAEMQDVIWPGCVSSSDDEWREWFAGHDITNFAWSSQSRGFFTDRAGRDKLDDEELVRVWYSDDNFARRERAVTLASEFGCEPIHVALAYVLAQPFAQIPIIGPATVEELADSLRALEITLSAEQVGWLRSGR